ncbi:MAG: hypothetical protein QM669_13985 [Siphonobacter sp.]
MKSNSTFLPLLISVLPIVVFTVFFATYVLNVPWFDDFDAITDFFLDFISATSWAEKWHWLFIPNNEHRMITGKLITLAVYYLTGQLDYTWIQSLANFSELIIWIVFLLAFRKLRLSFWYFVPISLILFQPQHYLVSFWAITGLQHQPLLMLMIATMYILALRTSFAFSTAILFALATTFTMSNGMFVWFAGLGVLLLRKRFTSAIIWGLGMFISISGYFYQFNSSNNNNSFAKFLEAPYLSFSGFFTFLGGGFDFFPTLAAPWRYVLPTIAGLLLFILVIHWLFLTIAPILKTYWNKEQPRTRSSTDQLIVQDFLLGVLFFLLGNATLIAVLRPHFGYHVLVVSNYKLYPAVFLCTAYVAWLSTAAKPTLALRWILSGSLFFCILSYAIYYPKVVERRKYLLASTFNQEHSNVGLGAIQGSWLEGYISHRFREPMRLGVFNPPIHYFDDLLKQTEEPSPLSIEVEHQGDAFFIKDPTLVIPNGRDQFVMLYLKSKTDQYLFPMQPAPNLGRNPLRTGKGAMVEVTKEMIHPGNYDLQLLYRSDQIMKRYSTLKTLSF